MKSTMSMLSLSDLLLSSRFHTRVVTSRPPLSTPKVIYTRFQLRDRVEPWPFDWCTAPSAT